MENFKIESCINFDQIEVKPCPFCGGEPELKRKGKNGIHIRCKSCGMGNFQRVITNSMQWLESSLLEDWNKRVSEPEITEGREIKDVYQKLFNYMSEQHDVILLESDMTEIIYILNGIRD